MWSFGCIIAELYKGTPIFPGQNEFEQLSRIIEVLGTPNQYHLSVIFLIFNLFLF